MRRFTFICYLAIFFLLGCKEQPKQSTWNCLQTAQVSEDITATQNSIIVYSTPQSATSSGTVTIENSKLKLSSVLHSELTFSRTDSGNKMEMTLLSADLDIVKDELDLLSDGRARALIPEIGGSISGEIIYQKDGFRRVKYDNGATLECSSVDV